MIFTFLLLWHFLLPFIKKKNTSHLSKFNISLLTQIFLCEKSVVNTMRWNLVSGKLHHLQQNWTARKNCPLLFLLAIVNINNYVGQLMCELLRHSSTFAITSTHLSSVSVFWKHAVYICVPACWYMYTLGSKIVQQISCPTLTQADRGCFMT